MKVIHIITRLDKGGSSRVLLDIVRGFNRENFDIQIISGLTEWPHEDLAKFSRDTAIGIIFVKALRRNINIFFDIISLFQLYRLLRKLRPTIVHTHTSKAGLLGRLAAHWAGVPVILYMPHGNIFYGYYPSLLTNFFVFIERLAAPLAERIITLTDIGKEEFLKRGIGKRKQFITIANGIDIEKYSQIDTNRIRKLKQRLEIDGNLAVISVIGRLEPVKGIEVFVDALAHLAREHLRFRALIAGEGSLKEKLAIRIRRQQLENKVVFLDYSYNIAEIIYLSDLIVNPALNEGFGMIVLEAAVFLKPVIASRVGGLSEVVEDGKTGILVKPGDSLAIAEAISSLIRNREYARGLGQRARERTEKQFSLNAQISKIEDLYMELEGKKFNINNDRSLRA